MNKYIVGLVISVFLSTAAIAAPHSNSSSISKSSSHSSSSAGATSGSSSGSSSSSGGNSLSVGPTVTLPAQPPASYYSDGHIFAGSDGNGNTVFVVEPKIIPIAPGVVDRDGQVFVDGHSATCDQAQRGGLPLCYKPIGS